MTSARIFALCAASGLSAAAVFVSELLAASDPSAAAPTPAAESTSAGTLGAEVGERTVEDGGTGPFKAIMVGDSSLPTHTIFRPKDLSAFGDKLKLPILAWGNGGCANSPSGHQNYLSEIASHGFLVVAIGPMATGGGRRGGGGGGTQSSQLIDAINWAIAQNTNQASKYFNKIDTSKIGVFGHSCGGLQALEVSLDKRITTTIVVDSGILPAGGGAPGGGARRGAGGGRGVPGAGPGGPAPSGGPPGGAGGGRGAAPAAELYGLAPGGGAPAGAGGGRGVGMVGMPALSKDHLAKLHAPVFYLLGGSQDIAYANGMDDFKRLEKLPTFVANRDVGHGGTFSQRHGGDWAMVSTAWFKWQLKDDAEAAKLFTGNPSGLSKLPGWTVDKKNIP
jgi:hypothetical protein